MRGARVLVAVLTAVLVAVPLSAVRAVGTGNPVIESPAGDAKHYAGFNGPFVVELDDAPTGTYDYYVETAPAEGAPVQVGAKQVYEFNGSFTRPELRGPALAAGAYTFRIADRETGTHAASHAFTVSAGKPPTCSIVLPSQVRMKARSALVPARLSATCRTLGTTYAAWEARHPVGGFAQTFIFDRTTTDSWRIYDDERTGTYTVRPNSAKTQFNERLPQNTARLTLRMDSRLNLTAKRSGSSVTLRTTSTRYSPSANRFTAWRGRAVVLSYRSCDACAWKRLKVRTTDRLGRTSYRFKAPRARQYRAVAAGTSTTWAPRPDHVRR